MRPPNFGIFSRNILLGFFRHYNAPVKVIMKLKCTNGRWIRVKSRSKRQIGMKTIGRLTNLIKKDAELLIKSDYGIRKI